MELIQIITFVIAIVNAIFMYLIYKTVVHKFAEYDRNFSEINIESELEVAFSETSQKQEGFNEVVRELFERVKLKFGFTKVSSYTDMITTLKKSTNVDLTLRKVLIDFFEQVMVLSYRNNEMSNKEKSDLRKELKIILKKFQGTK